MADTKPVASLGPLLLARKGGAKPAMRAAIGPDARCNGVTDDFEDMSNSQSLLGWNDLGEDAEEAVILPGPGHRDHAPTQQRIANDRAGKERRRAVEQGRRAAFTLRLDAERHLRLKLAGTIRGESAQQIVTEALDRLLADIPELDALAAQIGKNGSSKA
mgnify:CR=1 FL=1